MGEDVSTAFYLIARDNETADVRTMHELAAYLAERDGDPAWLNAQPWVLEGYLPDGWRGMTIGELAAQLDADEVTASHCIPA